MLIMRKRVALTIALFHVAGKVFIHLPLLVFQPFWTFFVLILFWTYWITVLLFLGTTGKQSTYFKWISLHFCMISKQNRLKSQWESQRKKAQLLWFYSCLLHWVQNTGFKKVIVHLSFHSQHGSLCVRLAFWFDANWLAANHETLLIKLL